MSEQPANPEQAAPQARGAVSETVKLSEEEKLARKRRNRMIAFGLFGFAALICITTMVRLYSNVNTGG